MFSEATPSGSDKKVLNTWLSVAVVAICFSAIVFRSATVSIALGLLLCAGTAMRSPKGKKRAVVLAICGLTLALGLSIYIGR